MDKTTKTVSIPAGLQLNDPIFLNQFIDEQKRLFVVLQDNATAMFYEQDHTEEIVFFLGKQSRLTFFSLITKTGTKKIEIVCTGEGAQARVCGFYLLDGHKKLCLQTKQNHYVQNTKTDLFLRGAVTDSASVNHRGKIFVEKNAQQAKAVQNNKTILLSSGAYVQSCPELQVLNKNVQCSHGTASGQPDEQQLFYLCSRGIPKKIAQRLLLEAFFTLPFAGVDDRSFKKVHSNFFLKNYRRWYEAVAQGFSNSKRKD